jgi:hypothetical protein
MARQTKPPNSMLNNTAVIVLGMHRSGTSALAGMLSMLGIQFGKSLFPPRADNPKGFWEHREIVDLNDRLLMALGSTWDDIRLPPSSWWCDEGLLPFRAQISQTLRRDFTTARLWGIKDPRLCRLVPLWSDLLDQLGCRICFILIHRHPLEVAHSLRRRDGFDVRKSGLLWLQHNLLSEMWTRGQPRLFVSYDQILEHPDAMSVKISDLISQPAELLAPQQMDAVRGFLSADLRHNHSVPENWGTEFGEYQPLLEKAYKLLSTKCRVDTPGDYDEFDRLLQGYKSITSRLDPAVAAHMDDLALRISELRGEIDRITSSRVWKMAKPLRGAKKLSAGVKKATAR